MKLPPSSTPPNRAGYGIRQTNGHTYIDTEHNAFIADQRPEELIGQWKRITGHTPA